MSWINWMVRLRSSLLAALAGWLAGVAITFPVQAGVAWRNTDGQTVLMLRTLALGIVIWGTWTLVFSLIAWLIFAVPLVSLLAPAWLQARRGRLLGVVTAAAIALPAERFGLFSPRKSIKQFDVHNFLVYSIFGVSYATVALTAYLRMERRSASSATLVESRSNVEAGHYEAGR